MRRRRTKAGVSVHAIAGSHVVLLGLDAEPGAARGLLGFAIHRKDNSPGADDDEREGYWLRSFRTFEATDPEPVRGSLVSSRDHPIQSFLWGDYTAKPGREYAFKVIPVYGTPRRLRPGAPVRITVTTENQDIGHHAIYFNRGVAGSQAYARKFGNRKPDRVPGAYRWLSRGLEEAILSFIGRAKSARYGLRVAAYEFSYPPVLDALAAASRRGADVRIIYDHRGNEPGDSSLRAIKNAGIEDLVTPRRASPSFISHNKFIVLVDRGRPVEVWTGSTNFTESGIFGQSNVGHLVRDRSMASQFHAYWQELHGDPTAAELRPWVVGATPEPEGPMNRRSINLLLSPRTSLRALNWYAERMADAEEAVCFTAAFGVNSVLADVLAEHRPFLRYLLLEKPGNNMGIVSRDRNNRIAIGGTLDQTEGELHRWLAERLTGLNVHVRFVHTKYMLIDPLGDAPTVISGSANFSDASTRRNDENMLIIRGNSRVADIYLGEFMRLFNHFYFRHVVRRQQRYGAGRARKSAYLVPDDSWCRPYYREGSTLERQRLLFR